MTDMYGLSRFVIAQQPVYDEVRAELRAARKRGHWIWFIFPQMRGLGLSSTSQHFAIVSLAEATAYLAHPVLGPRLHECTELVLGASDITAEAIFGEMDSMKFRSSMTLFARAAGSEESPFSMALARFYNGQEDERTLAFLSAGAGK